MTAARVPRAWIWLTIALLAVGALQVMSSVSSERPPLLDPTSARPDGALALNLWLQRTGYTVRVTRDPSLPGLASRSTLMVLEPQSNPGLGQRHNLVKWVRTGGRLVIISDSAGAPDILSDFGYGIVDAAPAPIEVVQPLLATPPAAHLAGSPMAVVTTNDRGVEVARTHSGPVVVRNRVGNGVVWVVSAPQLATNRGIARADNRRLMLNLAGARGSQIVLDEITLPAASNGPPSSDWLTSTTWGIVILFGICMLLLYRGLSGRRLGPPIQPHAAAFRPAVEYVLSMAGLLRRGRKRAEALLPYQQALQGRVLQRYGSLDAHPEARELLTPATDITEHELLRKAAAIVDHEEELGRHHD